MDLTTLWSTIMDAIIIPVIIALATAIIIIAKSGFNRISKSITAKNELAAMESQQAIREKLVAMIDDSVKAAVASNMSTVEKLKENNHKLTNDEIKELNESAKELVLNTLPPELTDEEGTLLSILGGSSKLDGLIASLIEKYVYEYKLIKAENIEML